MMLSLTRHTLLFGVAILAQCIAAGGLAAFSILARTSGDRLYPRGARWTRCARLMHGGRLHTILVLVGLEAAVIAWTARLVPPLCSGAAVRLAGGLSWTVLAIPAVLIQVAAAVVGVGIAVRRPAAAARFFSLFLCPFYVVFRPLSGLFLRVVSLVFPDLPDELASPLLVLPPPDSPGEGFREENGSRLVHSIVEFGEKRVREVMVPRIDVFAVDSRMTVAKVRRTVSRSGHSRVPVYEGTIDRVIGMLYVKDIVDITDEDAERTGIDQLVRDAYFVPEGKKIDDLLREFRMRRQHMAVVVDEYGGTSGIVTLEDILEEIVGEITDEYDRETSLIRRTGEASYLIEGRTPLDDLRDTLGIDLQSEEVDTLGGLLYDLLGRVPTEGEQIESDGIVFRIERLDGQRIAEVLVTLPGAGGA
jgi:CBS domain containing-hemolysin-like protein